MSTTTTAGVTMTGPLSSAKCTHDGVHGPDSEPGAVQRCVEETIAVRVMQAGVGKVFDQVMEELQNELMPELLNRAIRETIRLQLEDGTLTSVVMEPDEDFGRTKPWDAEGIDG